MHMHGGSPGSIDVETTPLGFSPRVFALCQTFFEDESEDGECEEGGEGEAVEEVETVVVAWGMTLPDGSAVAVRPGGPGMRATTFASSPESAARIHCADVVWAPTA